MPVTEGEFVTSMQRGVELLTQYPSAIGDMDFGPLVCGAKWHDPMIPGKSWVCSLAPHSDDESHASHMIVVSQTWSGREDE